MAPGNSNTINTTTRESEINESNMLRSSNDSKFLYSYGGINYQYFSGRLYCVSWENNNLKYSLLVNQIPSDFQFTISTPLSELLNISDKTPSQLQHVLAGESNKITTLSPSLAKVIAFEFGCDADWIRNGDKSE